MKPIRVMHLNSPVQIGGAEKVLMMLLRDMKGTTAFDSTVATFVTHGGPRVEFVEESRKIGIDTRVITTKKRCRFVLTELIRNLLDLCLLLKKEKIQLMHTHGYKADIVGAAASKILNVPIVGTAHGWTSCSTNVKVYEFIDRLALRLFNRVIAVSDSTKDRLLESRIPPQKIEKIYNAVEVEVDKKPRNPEPRTPNSELRIGTIGRLSIEKGLNYFLEAGKAVIARYPQARLLIVGDGPERENLEALAERLSIKDKVLFYGFQKDIGRIYTMLDVVVLSSITEGLPITLLEALAHEKPVVATRVGGVPELIKDGETGLLVNAKDPSRLAECILRMLDNPAEAKALAAGGRKLVEDEFDSKGMRKRTEKLYYEVLNLTPDN